MRVGLSITSWLYKSSMHMQPDIESTVHCFLHCIYYNSAKISLLNYLNYVGWTLLSLSDFSLVNILLYGVPQSDDSQNAYILNSSIRYILIYERYSGRLF